MVVKEYLWDYKTLIELNFDPDGAINISYGLYQKNSPIFLICLSYETEALVAEMHDFELDIIEELRCLRHEVQHNINYFLDYFDKFREKVAERLEDI
jgi:hypothetical protein